MLIAALLWCRLSAPDTGVVLVLQLKPVVSVRLLEVAAWEQETSPLDRVRNAVAVAEEEEVAGIAWAVVYNTRVRMGSGARDWTGLREEKVVVVHWPWVEVEAFLRTGALAVIDELGIRCADIHCVQFLVR
jgi:hypothetical protein